MMSILDHFSLPYLGMKDGLHRYEFDADDAFFHCFEQSPILSGSVKVLLDVDKKPSLSVLDFEIDGQVRGGCDRCLAEIDIPVEGKYQLHAKIGDPSLNDDEVIYITQDQSKLDLSQSIYEFILISMPMSNTIDCETLNPRPCNQEILNKWASKNEQIDNEDKGGSSIWESLKGLDLD
jgi:uncharacterized protein